MSGSDLTPTLHKTASYSSSSSPSSSSFSGKSEDDDEGEDENDGCSQTSRLVNSGSNLRSSHWFGNPSAKRTSNCANYATGGFAPVGQATGRISLLLFYSFGFGTFGFVSGFGFRASDFESRIANLGFRISDLGAPV